MINTIAKKKIVFIVDDDIFLAKAYQIGFRKEGAEVWMANDGKEALSFLEKEAPNVVLLDLMLPGASGFDIISAIHKDKRWKDVPIVAFTQLGQPEDIERCRALGVAEYLVKPNYRMSEVIDIVKKYL